MAWNCNPKTRMEKTPTDTTCKRLKFTTYNLKWIGNKIITNILGKIRRKCSFYMDIFDCKQHVDAVAFSCYQKRYGIILGMNLEYLVHPNILKKIFCIRQSVDVVWCFEIYDRCTEKKQQSSKSRETFGQKSMDTWYILRAFTTYLFFARLFFNIAKNDENKIICDCKVVKGMNQ